MAFLVIAEPPDEYDKWIAVQRATAREPTTDRTKRGQTASTADHKKIGFRFIVTAFGFFIAAGILALLVRSQLARPDNNLLGPDLYNQVFIMHGATMMFLFAVPIMQAVGIYLTPLFIGSRAIAFPRMLSFAYWIYLAGGLMLYIAFFLNIGPDVGWFAYTPLSGPEYRHCCSARRRYTHVFMNAVTSVAGRGPTVNVSSHPTADCPRERPSPSCSLRCR